MKSCVLQRLRILRLYAAAFILCYCSAAFAGKLKLWYATPASATNCMNEALPIGNGRLGALICGGPTAEFLVLNESSLWTGNEISSDNYGDMGAYQLLGSLRISMPTHNGATNYHRELDISEAIARTTYQAGGVTYQREYFCSHPDDALVVRFTADKPASYSGAIKLRDGHGAPTAAEPSLLSINGELKNGGMNYATRLLVVNDGGSLRAADGQIEFANCNSLTLLLAARTDYVMDYARHWHGEDPQSRVVGTLSAAKAKLQSGETLEAAHTKDFQSLFNRVSLNLGRSSSERLAMPIDQRKVLYAQGGDDPELEELMFQYGRYLLISSSRPGALPANLQGIWNDRNNPPWHSDYHVNINIQMNYWLAEPANLAECHEPLLNLICSQLEPWRKATREAKEFKAGGESCGWAVRTSHGIHGDMAWKWDQTANAWYCQHFWWHYAFGGDKRYLEEVAYPVLKETCQFWEGHLKALPDGRLVVPNAWSPEHGPTEDGVSYSQQIIYDLFGNYIAAADALAVDPEYRRKVLGLREKLVGPKIGRWGQLQEWMTDRDDPKDHHRHTSHLFAVFPGDQIGMTKTPELAAAARKSLEARGQTGDVREWSFAWRTALFARLHDGEAAHRMLQQLLAPRNTCVNLFGLHPPMQIDGNFGITAAICEMLVQSQEDQINLLPALPKEWTAGSIAGLCARGGFEVDAAWQGQKLVKVTIRSRLGGPCRLRYGATEATIQTVPGNSYSLSSEFKPL
jgi:alpha-L-fucosidase 2